MVRHLQNQLRYDTCNLYHNIKANQILTIREGDGIISPRSDLDHPDRRSGLTNHQLRADNVRNPLVFSALARRKK